MLKDCYFLVQGHKAYKVGNLVSAIGKLKQMKKA